MTGFSITVFLPEGEPDGLRLVEKSHWTGVGLMTRRDRFPKDRKRDEFGRSGVYILLGPSEDDLSVRRIYIGETRNVGRRISAHIGKKDFWTELVFFTKNDDSLDKADIEHLEAELIQLARKAGIAEVDNEGPNPAPPGPTEAKRADIDSFLFDMLVIFRLLGIDAFDVPGPDAGFESYEFTLGGTNGRGTPTRKGFLVREGSRGNARNLESITKGYAALRRGLIDHGVAAEEGDELIFRRDHEFESPSAAGSALYGGSTSGPQHWRRESDKKSIKEIEAELLAHTDMPTE